jgi:hypothetical protein
MAIAAPGDPIVIGNEYTILENYTYLTGVYTLHSLSTFTPATAADLPDGVDGPSYWDTVTAPTGGGGGGTTTVTPMVFRGAWASGTAYIGDLGAVQQDVVNYNGGGWVCWANHTSSSTNAPDTTGVNWQPLGAYSRKNSTASTYWVDSYSGLWASGKQYEAGGNTWFPISDTVSDRWGGLYSCIADHVSTADNEPGVEPTSNWSPYWMLMSQEWIYFAMIWSGEWTSGNKYWAGDGSETIFNIGASVVAHNGTMYMCKLNHDADFTSEPQGADFMGPSTWQTYWEPLASGGGAAGAKQQSILGGIIDGAMDWMKTATIGDWLGAVVIGAGIVAAGTAIVDSFTKSGDNPGASSLYNGTLTYNGSYTVPSLRSVVGTLCDEAGIISYDVSLLDNTIPCSFSLSQVTSIRTILDNFSKAYQFDMVDSSGTLKFVPRNSTSVRTFTHTDMGFNTSNQNIAPVTKKRMQTVDLPKSVALTYISADLDYNSFTQMTELSTFKDGQQVTLSVPFVMDHQAAKDTVDQILIAAHLERQQYIFKTSYAKAMDLEPGDVITIPEGQVRIIAIEEQEEGILQITTVDAGSVGAPQPVIVGGVTIGYTASTYEGTGQFAAIPSTPVNVALEIGDSGMLFIDPPTLGADDTVPRAFAVVHGYGKTGWPGATIHRSYDNGESYVQIGKQNVESTWGISESAISSGSTYGWDDSSVITVKLKTGTLNSATDTSVLAGANLLLIGKELLNFGVATLIGPGEYHITHLLRGKQGTEWAISTHVVNELVVLMDSNLFEIVISDTDRGKTWTYKVVTNGSDITKADPQQLQIFGNNLLPWTATNLAGARDATTEDWNLTWIGRAKFNNGFTDYVEAPNDPDFGGFAICIYNGTTLVRKQIVYGPSFAYTKVLQVQDFGSAQTTLKYTITQISNKYGGGHTVTVTL